MLDTDVREQCWISRPSEGAACCWKGLDLSNIAYQYEVNPLTYDKVITENTKW